MKATKKITLAMLIMAVLWTPSCKKNQQPNHQPDVVAEASGVEGTQTYMYAYDRDTVLLTLESKGDSVSGKLDFLPYEKDSRRGMLSRIEHQGDTLFAIYESMQEGEVSECEIALLKKDDSYILTNDIFGQDNYTYNADYTKGRFKDKRVIKFDGETLTKVATAQ